MDTSRSGARAPTLGRPGLTLLEVLVVIAVVVIVVGLLLPSVRMVRVSSTRSASTNHLKMIGLGAQNYHDQFLRFPGNGSGVGDGLASPENAADGSFFYQILPFMEHDALFRTPVSHNGHNPVIVKFCIEPGRGRNGNSGSGPVSDYAVNLLALYGDNAPPTPLNTKDTINLSKITDGSSNTILVGSKSIHPTGYNTTDPAVDDTFLKLSSGGTSTVGARYTVGATTVLEDLTAPPPAEYLTPTAVRDLPAAQKVLNDQFGGPYPAGALFVFTDGHVASLSYSWLAPEQTVPIKPVTWGKSPTEGTFDRVSNFRAILTPRGGEAFQFE